MKKTLTLISIAFLVLSMFWLIAPEATVSAGSTSLDPDASVPELAWASGDPYPVVNGHVIFPAAPAYNIHWWAGGVYPSQSPTQNARTAYMSIRVPYSAPKSDEFYYVLLSAWDSNGSYNQLGFSNTYGTWGLTYSWTTRTTAGKLVYHYTSNAMAVSLGVTYTFYITTDNGVTHFVAKQGSVQVWSLDTSTGGNFLVLNNTYSPYGFDYTVYEEIWTISTFGGAPDFDFYFFNNYWVSTNGVTNAATWIDFFTTGAPNNVDIVTSGNSVLVDNPKATILFQTNPTSGTITFGLGGVGPTYVNGQSVNSITDSDPLSMFPYSATANAPSGYGFDHWEYSGSSDRGVYVPDINSNPTTIEVNGDGWLKAVFSVHDIAVTDVKASPTNVLVGNPVSIDVDVLNEGTVDETFDANLYYDTTLIGTMSVTLSSGASTTLAFTWDTTNVSPGTYTIRAEVPPVTGETHIADNEFIDGKVTITPIPVYVDIKPGSWPNPINVGSKGVFAVAICGTKNFNVKTVDPTTVKLYIGGIAQGVSPIRWSYQDVATPYVGSPGGGHALKGDGYLDIVFYFNTQTVVTKLGLAGHVGETIPLIIKGSLCQAAKGLPIQGQDYIRILK